MHFCIITPTAGLELFATKSNWHMVLAPQFVKDQEYARFYVERQRAGDFIILDNGAYEDDYQQDMFLQALRVLLPNVATLPDIIMKGPESTARSLEFLRHYGHMFPNVQWLYMPQGRDLVEWCESLSKFPLFYELGVRWIGLTRFLRTHVYQVDDVRVDAAKWVRDRWPHVNIHAFGMANGDVGELDKLREQGYVESCDSSAPVWRGWNLCGLTDAVDLVYWDEKGTPVDFSVSLPEFGDLIKENLEACLGPTTE